MTCQVNSKHLGKVTFCPNDALQIFGLKLQNWEFLNLAAIASWRFGCWHFFLQLPAFYLNNFKGTLILDRLIKSSVFFRFGHLTCKLYHNIWESKLFVVQALLEITELKNYWGSRGSQYDKKSLELSDESWVIKSFRHEVVLIRQKVQYVVFKAETLADFSAKILIEYILQEPRYSNMKFVWRITPILKKKFRFDSLHISDDVHFRTVLSFLYINQGGLRERVIL